MKAKVEKRGSLAFIVTEHGQKAVVPWDSLCNFIAKYGLEVEVKGAEPPKCVEVRGQEISEEVEEEGEEKEYEE